MEINEHSSCHLKVGLSSSGAGEHYGTLPKVLSNQKDGIIIPLTFTSMEWVETDRAYGICITCHWGYEIAYCTGWMGGRLFKYTSHTLIHTLSLSAPRSVDWLRAEEELLLPTHIHTVLHTHTCPISNDRLSALRSARNPAAGLQRSQLCGGGRVAGAEPARCPYTRCGRARTCCRAAPGHTWTTLCTT